MGRAFYRWYPPTNECAFNAKIQIDYRLRLRKLRTTNYWHIGLLLNMAKYLVFVWFFSCVYK